MYVEKENHLEVRELAATLYREQRGYLLAIARRNAATRSDAEEAVQDALGFFIDHFDPGGKAPALPWLILKRQYESLVARPAKAGNLALARLPGHRRHAGVRSKGLAGRMRYRRGAECRSEIDRAQGCGVGCESGRVGRHTSSEEI